MDYIRYTESVRMQLLRLGYKFIQWGTRLSAEELGQEAPANRTCFELVLHRQKVGNRRTVYELDGEKASEETNLAHVQFYVRMPI